MTATPATRHEQQALLIGHARGGAGRLLAVVRVAAIETHGMRAELVRQLELAGDDLEAALLFARLLEAEPAPRR